jgi:UrcA family protein
MTRNLIVAFAAAAALSFAAPAMAEETVRHDGCYIQKTVSVSPAGYDLDTVRGAERFHDVLACAVRQACDTGDRTLTARRQQQDCVAETMTAAVAQLGKPYLAVAHAEATGRRIVIAAR